MANTCGSGLPASGFRARSLPFGGLPANDELSARIAAETALLGLDVGEAALAARFWTTVVGAEARTAPERIGTWLLRHWFLAPVLVIGFFVFSFGYCAYGRLGAAQIQTARLDLRGIANGVELYAVETGELPANLEMLVPKYVKELHRDPWGRPYYFARRSDRPSVFSVGEDGVFRSADDISISIALKPEAGSR